MKHDQDTTHRLVRLPEVLRLVPVSKSTWWEGIRNGTFPKPIKLGPKITCWRLADILELMNTGHINPEKPTKPGKNVGEVSHA